MGKVLENHADLCDLHKFQNRNRSQNSSRSLNLSCAVTIVVAIVIAVIVVIAVVVAVAVVVLVLDGAKYLNVQTLAVSSGEHEYI